jgi:hypothetical protein
MSGVCYTLTISIVITKGLSMKLILIPVLCTSITCYGFEFEAKNINSFTREVYYRYYLIKRCEEPVEILSNNRQVWRNINFDLISPEKLENVEIKNKALELQKSHRVEEFTQLWQQINTHRNLSDESFHKDFIKLLFMLYNSLEKQPSPQAITRTNSVEKMLSIIDKSIETIRPQKKNKFHNKHKFIDYKQVTTDDIALNYYLMHRLSKSIELLATIKDPFPESAQQNSASANSCDTAGHFSHDRINTCFNQILAKKNLEPILQMWADFTQFRHAGDTHFLKEMLMMLFSVYKDLLFTKLSDESEQVITSEMSTILDLYEHVNELPLNEILQAIDITTDKLILLQNMEKKGKAAWGQRYPVVFHTLLALPVAYLIIKVCEL